MRKYEIAFIVHPDLDDSAFKDNIDKVQGWITDAGGSIAKIELQGKKKLAYEINKQTEGQYVLVYSEMDPTFCTELERNFRFLESIMRFMVLAIEDFPEEKPVVE